MITSPDDFLIYSNILIFWVASRIKGQKMTKKKKKRSSVSLGISGTAPHMIVVFGTLV